MIRLLILVKETHPNFEEQFLRCTLVSQWELQIRPRNGCSYFAMALIVAFRSEFIGQPLISIQLGISYYLQTHSVSSVAQSTQLARQDLDISTGLNQQLPSYSTALSSQSCG